MIQKGYRPSIRKLQEDFARRIALKRFKAKVGRETPSNITDNSEPWVRNPNSIGDYLEISRRVAESERLWQSRFKTSSTA
jgi:hypothetical protein